jgi:ABC-type multidrug transport system permease subunit
MSNAAIQPWLNVRLAVSAALIIGSLVFFLARWYSMFKREENRSYMYMSEVASKYYLFGLGALLSLNYIQAGIFQSIMIYITMLSFFGIIFASLLH